MAAQEVERFRPGPIAASGILRGRSPAGIAVDQQTAVGGDEEGDDRVMAALLEADVFDFVGKPVFLQSGDNRGAELSRRPELVVRP